MIKLEQLHMPSQIFDLVKRNALNALFVTKGDTILTFSFASWSSLCFRLPYLSLIGGILAIPADHFLRVNGFSNMFWGWGGEDDDMFERWVTCFITKNRVLVPNIWRSERQHSCGLVCEHVEKWKVTFKCVASSPRHFDNQHLIVCDSSLQKGYYSSAWRLA